MRQWHSRFEAQTGLCEYTTEDTHAELTHHPFISVRRNNVAFFDVYHLKMKEWIYLDKKRHESKEDQPEQSNTTYYREKAARAGASLKNNMFIITP